MAEPGRRAAAAPDRPTAAGAPGWWAGGVLRRPRAVLVLALVVAALGGLAGLGLLGRLSGGGLDDPGSESSRAAAVVARDFHLGDPDVVLLVTARQGTVDSPAVAAAADRLTGTVRADRAVGSVLTYWQTGREPALVSRDHRSGLVLVSLAGSQHDKSDAVRRIDRLAATDRSAVTVDVGGYAVVFRAVQSTVIGDLVRTEAIVVPISMLLLVLVFRGVVAAALPVLMGGLSSAGTVLVLRILTTQTEVSIFALNLTTALGLGLGIDYGLLMVTRFRDELAGGLAPPAAVARTLATAGRTVVFSGVTVAASLATLLIFPLPFLRSFGYAAVPVVLLAVLAAMTVLPALLLLLGDRVNRGAPRRLPAYDAGEGGWLRWAGVVMRLRWPVTLVGIAVLVGLALPVLHIRISLSDERVLPAGTPVRQAQERIAAAFDDGAANPVDVLVPARRSGPAGPAAAAAGPVDVAEADRVAARLSRLPDVAAVRGGGGTWTAGRLAPDPRVALATVRPAGAVLSVLPAPGVGVYSPAAARLVHAVRAVDAGRPLSVTGQSAHLVDDRATIARLLPWAVGGIVAFTLVLLFAMTGSVVVPLKAVAVDLLSISAMFGAVVWGFQHGHLAGLLGFTRTGSIDDAMPVLMFSLAFGVSMDYEVFLLARIQEEYRRSGDNAAAVAAGLRKTGRIFTSAALLLAVVFAGLIASRVTLIKMVGAGLAFAILLDATLVRGALVPAVMRLMGRANWWAPAPLRALHRRVHLDGDAGPRPSPAETERVPSGAVR